MIGEVVGLVVNLVVDVLRGSKCYLCGGRSHDLALHQYIDHADVIPHPEPSRFEATGPEPQP